jgi:hypothetical protein
VTRSVSGLTRPMEKRERYLVKDPLTRIAQHIKSRMCDMAELVSHNNRNYVSFGTALITSREKRTESPFSFDISGRAMTTYPDV